MTTLPERLRASAQVLRWLPPCTESSYEILDLVAWNIARELEEAAQALEAGRGKRMADATREVKLSEQAAAVEGADFVRGWNDAVEQVARLMEAHLVATPPSAQVAQEGGGVSASAYLAKVEADPRRAAALQRARDRTPGVTAIDGPRRGPEADGSQTPNAGSAIRPGKAGSNTDTRKLCTCDGAGRGPGRACVVKAGGRLGELWRCAEGHEPTPGVEGTKNG